MMVEPNTSRLTETLEILTHPYRRYTLYSLTNESKVINVDTLSTAITKWVGDQMKAGRSTDRKAVKIALCHTHLPKLADRDIISFCEDTGFIELRNTDGVDQFLVDTARIDEYVQTATGD